MFITVLEVERHMITQNVIKLSPAVHELSCQQRTRSPAVARVGRPYDTAYIRRLASDFRSRKAIYQSDYSLIYAMVTLLYRTLQPALVYNTVIQHTWVIGCRNQLCIQNCCQTAANKDTVTIDNL